MPRTHRDFEGASFTFSSIVKKRMLLPHWILRVDGSDAMSIVELLSLCNAHIIAVDCAEILLVLRGAPAELLASLQSHPHCRVKEIRADAMQVVVADPVFEPQMRAFQLFRHELQSMDSPLVIYTRERVAARVSAKELASHRLFSVDNTG